MKVHWTWRYEFDNRPPNMKAWLIHYRWRMRFIVADVLYALAFRLEKWAYRNRDMTEFEFKVHYGLPLYHMKDKGAGIRAARGEGQG